MADVNTILKDAAYITIGLGVLTFQRAQVQRQELKKQLETQLDDAKGGFTKLSGTVDERVKQVEERFETAQKQLEERFEGVQKQVEAALTEIEANVDKALDDFAARLPESAREALNSARTAAKDARAQLLARVA
jgi:DNA anti-recombination protein RmuC